VREGGEPRPGGAGAAPGREEARTLSSLAKADGHTKCDMDSFLEGKQDAPERSSQVRALCRAILYFSGLCRKVDNNSLLSAISGIFPAQAFQYMV
jgi:hypothetical protein